MGLTAELLSKKHKISRREQDEFAMRSHKRAHHATISGDFTSEIIETLGHDSNGTLTQMTKDEVIRADTNLETLSSLKPVFDPKFGTITAGNSSALSDGASVIILMAESKAKELNIEPLAAIKGIFMRKRRW